MPNSVYHYLEYLYCWPIFIVIITTLWLICPSALFKYFMSNSGVRTAKSVNHDRIQALSYCKYSLLFLPLVGIEPATSRWFNSEALPNQMPYPLCYVSLLDNSEWIFRTYKPNVSITSPLSYQIIILFNPNNR